MLAQIGQGMLTDFAAMTMITAVLILAALLTRNKREQAPRVLVLLRRVVLTGAAIVCMLAPRFGAEITTAHGVLLGLFMIVAELGSWP